MVFSTCLSACAVLFACLCLPADTLPLSISKAGACSFSVTVMLRLFNLSTISCVTSVLLPMTVDFLDNAGFAFLTPAAKSTPAPVGCLIT